MNELKLKLHMSTIDLIILGILLDKKKNAYELAKLIEDRGIDKFLKVSVPAIYKNCKRLYQSGYLNGQRVQEGEMPEKLVYSINKKGKEHFHNLMKYYSSSMHHDPTPFFIDFNSFLWNIEKLEMSEAIEMLENLQFQLMRTEKWIIQHEKEAQSSEPFSSRMIIKQYRMMVATLVIWVEETIEEYKIEKKE